MKFDGLLNFSEKAEEISNGLDYKNDPKMFSKNLDLELYGIKDTADKEYIFKILNIVFQNKNNIDEEVLHTIKRLSIIGKGNLESLHFFILKDTNIVKDIVQKMNTFDVGFTREDYGKCPFDDFSIESFVDMNEVDEKLLVNLAVVGYTEKLIKKEQEREMSRTRLFSHL